MSASSGNPPPGKIIVFDPGDTGHHEEYLRHLWTAAESTGNLPSVRFYISETIAQHSPFNQAARVCRCHSLSTEVSQERLLEENMADFLQPGNLLFFPRLNQYIPVLMHHRAPKSFRGVSGIFFAPPTAVFTSKSPSRKHQIMSCLRALRQIGHLRCVHSQVGITQLFILNDAATARITGRLTRLGPVVQRLSDPVEDLPEAAKTSDQLRSRLGINKESRVYLALGAMRPSKGILETLLAFSKWQVSQPVSLVLAGKPLPTFHEILTNAVQSFRPVGNVDLCTHLDFMSKEEMAGFLRLSDCLLVPYQSVYGSSGILGHAARECTPVLCNRAGLIGRLTQSYQLGLTMNPSSLNDYVRALDASLHEDFILSPSSARTYCEDNSVSAFQHTIIQSWLRAFA